MQKLNNLCNNELNEAVVGDGGSAHRSVDELPNELPIADEGVEREEANPSTNQRVLGCRSAGGGGPVRDPLSAQKQVERLLIFSGFLPLFTSQSFFTSA